MALNDKIFVLDLNLKESSFIGSVKQAIGDDYDIVDFDSHEKLSSSSDTLPDSLVNLLLSRDFKCVIVSFDTKDGEESLNFLNLLEDFSYRLPVIAVGEDEAYAVPAISRGAHEFVTYESICPCLQQIVENSIIRHDRWRQQRFDTHSVRSQLEVESDAWVVSNLQGCILYANQAAEKVFGQTCDELVGQNFGVPAEEGTMEIEIVRHTQHGPQLAILEMRVLDIVWKGEKAFLQLIHDVTDHQKQIRESRDAIRQRDQFLATLSHELRNPLTALMTSACLLEEEDLPEDQKKELIKMTYDQCKSMEHLLDELMDLSRISRSKVDLFRQPVSVSQLVRESVAIMRAKSTEKQQTIVNHFEDENVLCNGDIERLKQVFNNLLSNAIKYSPNESMITIQALVSDAEVTISVEDEGRGIDEHMLESIFEPFVQLRHTDNSRGEGLGIGLALCRKLVEMHDGRVWAESKGENNGSIFLVSLPRYHGEETQSEDSKEDEYRINGNHRSVVLVEDRKEVRLTLSLFLKSLDFNVDSAENGNEGLKKIVQQKPDLAVVDLGLPDITGYDLAKSVRREMGNHTVLVALSGHGEKRDKQLAAQAGFDNHITKPLTMDKLIEVLKLHCLD